MKTQALLSSILLLTLAPFLRSQDTVRDNARVEFAGLGKEQVANRIFKNERDMISGLQDLHPLLETYLQSLWTNTKVESPIDDAYFLSTVNFRRGYQESGEGRRGYQSFLFGQGQGDRKIRLNNGNKVAVYPDGYLDMLFVDLEDFDADTYDLTFLQKTTCDKRLCLLFSVTPKQPRHQGRFEGEIWVEKSHLNIVRIRGTFTPVTVPRFTLRRIFGVGSIPLYLHFDSSREEVAPGMWLPSYSYFDEDRTWRQVDRDAETDIHYRGHIFIWGYQNSTGETNAISGEPDLVVRLEKQGLLANPGAVEQQLDAIASRLLAANGIQMQDIGCRVLLTTPIELFSVGHTIIVSRGLLNILPDDSVIPLLLAHEIANIQHPRSSLSSGGDGPVWDEGVTIAEKAGYFNSVAQTSELFAGIRRHFKQVPNLFRARFSSGLLDIATHVPATSPTAVTTSMQPLTLRGKYTIDSWTSRLQVRQEPVGNPTAERASSF